MTNATATFPRRDSAPYAADPSLTRGRRRPEPAPRYRSEFQRDRDRIIHSKAFRRLEYKTQVFINHEGDLFRTRLTHSLEVAQIARTVSRVLGLNEDLTEAIALAHDLGHTPFGHAGQEALNECMREFGGFEHNIQSLRVVDSLEERYAEFAGLNLTFETREGILKHCAPTKAKAFGDVARRFIDGTQPSLEAQLANLADEIAYNSHDVDDGLRANLLRIEQIESVPPLGDLLARVSVAYPRLPLKRTIYEVVRRLIDLEVSDLIQTSQANLHRVDPRSIEEARGQNEPLIAFSADTNSHHAELKSFLFANLYRHHHVVRMTTKAKRVVRELFEGFMADAQLLPPQQYRQTVAWEACKGLRGRARAVADYIAGMTDRYAVAEHAKIFGPLQSD